MAKELSREELAELLAGIIEDNRKNPPKNSVKLCNRCRKKSLTKPFTCEVYPDWIPDEMLTGDCPDYQPKEKAEQR